MNRIISSVLFAAGIVLLVMGFSEADSVASSISRLFTDQPTDRALWRLIGGGALVLIGASGMYRGK